MKDLFPNTKYFYSIDGGNTVYNFSTFSSTNRTLRFAFTSDGHFGKEASNHTATKAIFDQVVNPTNGFDALFVGGDIVEMGFRDTEWRDALQFLSPYTTQIPFRIIAGNHDTFFGGVTLYKDYFYNRNAPIDQGSQLFYHITINSVHLFFLNLEWDTGTFTKAQRDWFESELKKLNPSDLILVFSHSFFYSSGIFIDGSSWVDIPDMISEVTPLFEQYGVDMVFSGHNHHMEYLEKNGVRYHIVGTMGGVLDPIPTGTSVASVWRQSGQHGFIDVNITPSNISVNYRTPEFLSLYNYTFVP
jgi:3',5'-cyclic AMP phosphodiesterase CpdA